MVSERGRKGKEGKGCEVYDHGWIRTNTKSGSNVELEEMED